MEYVYEARMILRRHVWEFIDVSEQTFGAIVIVYQEDDRLERARRRECS